MMILKYSDTEYLVHYSTKEGLYYRAYPINVGGVPCVQIQVIGNGEGPIGENEKVRYTVVSYTVQGGGAERQWAEVRFDR